MQKRNRILLILLLLTAFASLPTAHASASFSEDASAMNNAAQSVVLLHCYDKDENLVATASGFFVFDSMTIVTNYHALKGAYIITAFDENDSSFDVPLLYCYDEEKDIAVLRTLESFGHQPLELTNSDLLQRGENVVAIGSPLGVKNAFSTGIISSIDDGDGYRKLSFTAPISHGSSGGALFNDQGRVVGITTGSFTQGQNLNIAVASNEISFLMERPPSLETLKAHYDRTSTPRVSTVRPGVLTVATSADFYPWEYINEKGNMVGIEIEIIEGVAKALSLDVSYVIMPYEDTLSSLHTQTDIVANGMDYTLQRGRVALPCYTHATIVDEYGEFTPFFYVDLKNEQLHTEMIRIIRIMKEDGSIDHILNAYRRANDSNAVKWTTANNFEPKRPEQTWREFYSFAPELLRYLDNYAKSTEMYLIFYDEIWGDLTREYGDIIFDTLTAEQKALVHYPKIDKSNLTYVKGGSAYHATMACYTLLQASESYAITYDEAVKKGLSPCSKCVADQP